MRDAVRNPPRPGVLVVLGQVSLFVFLAISVALHPGLVLKRDEGGISNYGIHLKTVIPYTLAFLSCAWSSAIAARRYRSADGDARRFGQLLTTYSCLLVLTLVSTYGYTLDIGLKDIHLAVGVVIITFELVTSVWMYARLDSPWDSAFLVVAVVGFVLAGLTFLGFLHVLFVGQALADVGFALLLIHVSLVMPACADGPPPSGGVDGRAR
jgi:hypothetical protein